MRKLRMKNASTAKDRTLAAFKRKDIGKDAAATAVRLKVKQLPTSILLSPVERDDLKQRAERKGIGYQTLLKMIVKENKHKY
jgi:predicted DNA binding CopG/RHH family protein